MAARKQFLGGIQADPELVALMNRRRQVATTEDELQEQRISYAYGNAMGSEGVTKDSVRASSHSVRLRADA